MTLLYRFAQALACPFVYIYNRPEVRGRKHIPKDKAVILAANHSSYWDPLILSCVLGRGLHYLAKAELFESRISNRFFTSLGQIKVERGKSDTEALIHAIDTLREGKTLVFFPEGTTYEGNELGRAHTGVARVALKAEVPVVPVAISNSWRVLPRGKKLPKPLKVRVRFGSPLIFEEYYGQENNREVTREITDEIMGRIAELLMASEQNG